MEKRIRSLIKSLSWRIVATLTTIFLVFIYTGDLVISGSVGFFEFFLKILIYYLHERVWNMVSYGRERK